MLNPEHVTLQQKEHWATETLSAPSQTLITFLLTRSPLCYQLSGPCVLFRTINLALFTLVKITHPDTCREGLMTAPMDRLVRSVEVDDGWLMWWLLACKLCLHFSSCTYFPPCSFFCTYLQAGHSISAYISFSLPHIFLSSPSPIFHSQTCSNYSSFLLSSQSFDTFASLQKLHLMVQKRYLISLCCTLFLSSVLSHFLASFLQHGRLFSWKTVTHFLCNSFFLVRK